jgi:hypothetical protein
MIMTSQRNPNSRRTYGRRDDGTYSVWPIAIFLIALLLGAWLLFGRGFDRPTDRPMANRTDVPSSVGPGTPPSPSPKSQ